MTDFVEYKHLPVCRICMRMQLRVSARLHVLHAQAVCISSCIASVLCLSFLHITPLSSLMVVNITLPPTLLLTVVAEWFSSVTTHNGGWIL